MDRYKLQYEMKRKGVTIGQLCKKIGITRSTFYRKCRGLSEFTQGEIQSIVDYLELDNPMEIFFDKR